jgi:hypothetical protein
VPKRFENPVAIPTAVFDGLVTVQETMETSMLDHRAVQVIAARLGYPETTMWVQEHQQEYLEGIPRDLVVAE